MKKVLVLVLATIFSTACGVSKSSTSGVQSSNSSNSDGSIKDLQTVTEAKEDLETKYPVGTHGLNMAGVGGNSNSDTWISLGFETDEAKASFEQLMAQRPQHFSKKNGQWLYLYTVDGFPGPITMFVRVKLETIGVIIAQ